jgi:hypothetical protein
MYKYLKIVSINKKKYFLCFIFILFYFQSLEWRKRWDVDKLDEWEIPQILKDYLPHGLSGYDKDGAPGLYFYYKRILFFLFLIIFLH